MGGAPTPSDTVPLWLTCFSDHFAAFLPANATIEMMQEPEISLEAGMQPDEMVDELGRILGKYEVPMGLMNKRK
jgi:hypothetical protein